MHSEQNSAIPMADKSRPSTLIVYLYVPNILVRYVRILMNCFAFAISYKDKYLFSVLYFVRISTACLPTYYTQHPIHPFFVSVSTFGAVLDMVTDRISTACLLVILSQVYSPGMIFLSLLALDIASHWLQMYSSFLVGKASHKDVKDSSSWLFKLYYGDRKFMGYCCVSCEVLYIVLFLLAESQTDNLTEVLVNAATRSWLYLTLLSLSFIGWVIKQIVNVIQMKTAADACILYDIGKKR
ncbi:putative CDP-diacylglycerol--inositol 3-phosphatidyltransferase 2 [Sesamum angolense]|uniref:CDP-diacylglycerol--inositol 3-phosphatidyltransferase n=1 Tax=Sesamum angolense TaxID=2727404 RepID=A0AAE1WK46_9LAMI|nr:putative CDP-diacylglycerol--inositol 3-phosphatidyltransferase 2 [Sesamum angolense]